MANSRIVRKLSISTWLLYILTLCPLALVGANVQTVTVQESASANEAPLLDERLFAQLEQGRVVFEESDRLMLVISAVVATFAFIMVSYFVIRRFKRVRYVPLSQDYDSQRLSMATSVAGIGVWDWHILTDELIWNDSMYDLYNIDKSKFGGVYEVWKKMLHEDDVAEVELAVQQAVEGDGNLDTVFRIQKTDGGVRYIKALASGIRNKDGRVIRLLGCHWDVTTQKEAEIELLKHREHLEELVSERTQGQERLNQELKEFNDAMVGREMRVIELKEQVNDLCEELGKPQPYSRIWESSS